MRVKQTHYTVLMGVVECTEVDLITPSQLVI